MLGLDLPHVWKRDQNQGDLSGRNKDLAEGVIKRAQAYIVPLEQAKQSHGGTLLTHILRKNVAICEVNISILTNWTKANRQDVWILLYDDNIVLIQLFNDNIQLFALLLLEQGKKGTKKQGSALARPWFWEKHSQQSGLAARGLTYRHPQPSAEESVWGGEHSKQGLKGRRSGGAKLGTHKDTQTERCEGQLKDQTGPGEEG